MPTVVDTALWEIDLVICELSKFTDGRFAGVVRRLHRIRNAMLSQEGQVQDLTAEVKELRRRYWRYIDPPDDENG